MKYEETSEIRAVYFANVIRKSLGLDYYRYYYSDEGAKLVNEKDMQLYNVNDPILPDDIPHNKKELLNWVKKNIK